MAMTNTWKTRDFIFTLIAIAFSLFQLYTGTVGTLEPFFQRVIHLYFALVLVFLLPRPSEKEGKVGKIIDFASLGLVLLTGVYLVANLNYLATRFPLISPVRDMDIVIGVVFLLLLVEATRRQMGLALPIVTLVVVGYTLWGASAPGIFNHAGFSLANVVDLGYLTMDGTFGLPLGISAAYLFLFVLFGSFLIRTGLGDLIMQVGTGLAGHWTGGPAKIAVLTSAGTGMISGSAVANVVTTGSFTIPLMKKMGYKPHFAGAVEAVASTGGAITPPVMGVLAFLMSEYSGIPYGKIIVYAALPAFLYYFGVFWGVHFEALRMKLPVLAKSELPDYVTPLKQQWFLFVPVVVLLVLILKQYSPGFSVLVAIYSAIVVGLLNPRNRLGFFGLMKTLAEGAKDSLTVVLATAVAGFIGGLIGMTGLGLRLGALIGSISYNAYMLLALVALVLFLMGMALPATVAYIVTEAILVPPLLKFGLDPVASHLFLVYWATLAFITPPVGLAFYAAAGIAKTSVMKTGWAATRLALPVYLLTFMFALNPALLFRGGSIASSLLPASTAALGIFAIAASGAAYFLSDLNLFERLLLGLSGVLLVIPGVITDGLGILGFGAVLVIQWLGRNKERSNHVQSLN